MNVSELCSNAVRGTLVAEPGKKLVVSDLSNIEGRVLAWLAGEEWKLQAFRAYDAGTGHDLYKITAGRILGKDPGAITKDERQNQGKVPELAGGFGGSVGAYRKMGGPVFNAMSDEDILVIVKAWREKHPATVKLWYALERAVKDAIRNPGSSFVVSKLTLDCRRDDCGVMWLRVKLPNDSYLSYREPEVNQDDCETCGGSGKKLWQDREMVCPDCNGSGKSWRETITYMGIDQYTKKWKRLETYYGRVIENVVQKVAREVFMSGFLRAARAGYLAILRVHDELVCEVAGTPEHTHEELSRLLATNAAWNEVLPLAAAGGEMYRYSKGD